MALVTVENISKSYGSVKALQNINFEVQTGEIFGLIGPDGAGKTSLFRILTTLLLPDAGKATVNNWDVVTDYKSIRNHVGYMPGRFSLYPDLTVEENLNFFATIFNTSIQENYHLIKDIYIQLEPFKERRAGKLSGGMKQKLALCCALIHKPLVLFLDEPTTGVDPVSRKEFWQMLQRLKAQNITIIVSTPYMDEATLCDRIALIQQGEILSIDTPDKISNNFKGGLYAVKCSNTPAMLSVLINFPGLINRYAFGETVHVVLEQQSNAIATLNTFLEAKGYSNLEITQIPATIEDCFIQLNQQSS